jgi:hypothetical protein
MPDTLIQFAAWCFSINETQLPKDININLDLDLDKGIFTALKERIVKKKILQEQQSNNSPQTNESNGNEELISEIVSNEQQSKNVLRFLGSCEKEWENLQRQINPLTLCLVALTYLISKCGPEYNKKICVLLDANNQLNRDAISNFLSRAVSNDKLDVVKKLISLPSADTNAVSEVVKLAVREGKWHIVEALCESENKPNDEAFSFALDAAVCRGQTETVKKLCESTLARIPLDRDKADFISNVFTRATAVGSWNVVQMLCESYKDLLNSKAVSSVFRTTAIKGKWDIVRLLYNLFKDMDNLDCQDVLSASEEAINANQSEIAVMLCTLSVMLKKDAFTYALHAAIRSDRQWELVKVLVQVLCDSTSPLIEEESFSYALQQSARHGQVGIVQKLCGLLKNFSNANDVIFNSLVAAVHHGHLEVVEIFCGLSPEILTNEAVSNAFGLAVTERKWEIAKRLYQLLPERIVLRKEDGSVAIVDAVRADQKDIVQILLGLPAKSLRKESVLQALELAATNNNWNVLEQLCAYTLRNYNEPSINKFLELTRNHPSNVDQQFIRLKKIFILYESINKLHDYGEKISKSRTQDGSYAKIIANELRGYANELVASVLSGGFSNGIQTASIQKAFKQKLEEARNQMGNHCFHLGVILKNIAVALTLVGAVFIHRNWQNGYSRVLRLAEGSEPPTKIYRSTIVMQQANDSLKAYWNDGQQIAEKSFQQKEVEVLSMFLPIEGEYSSNQGLIKLITSKYNCTRKKRHSLLFSDTNRQDIINDISKSEETLTNSAR